MHGRCHDCVHAAHAPELSRQSASNDVQDEKNYCTSACSAHDLSRCARYDTELGSDTRYTACDMGLCKSPMRLEYTEMTTGHRLYGAQRKAIFPAFPGAPPPALPWVLKVENTLAVCVLPHCGQGVGTTNCGRKVKRSNVIPHSSQAYSKIGILHSSYISQLFSVYPEVSVPFHKTYPFIPRGDKRCSLPASATHDS